MIEPEIWYRKPVPVKVVQVTEKNMRDVARWCDGRIHTAKKRGDRPANKYIQVQVIRAISDRLTKAFVGDWILYMEEVGYKVFPDEAFRNSYEPAKKDNPINSVTVEVTQALTEFGNRIHEMTARLNEHSSERV